MAKLNLKVCGMRSGDNIQSVAALKPDFMGFIFYEGSPRNAEPMLQKSYLEDYCSNVVPVGVFVNQKADEIKRTLEKFGIRTVQLHGSERPELCFDLKKEGFSVWKVFSVATAEDLIKTADYETVSDCFLFDTKSPVHGGTGVKFDWKLLSDYTGRKEVMLSGGISPGDAELIKDVSEKHSYITGIDVNSRFETAPGLKNIQLLGEFTNRIRN